jgi:hypothetical protein
MLCANDHLVFEVPWLDGPTALAAVIEASGQMTLATTVALVAVRGPVPVAKALAAPTSPGRYESWPTPWICSAAATMPSPVIPRPRRR